MIFNSEKKIFRKIGYFKDQDGIFERYLSEKENWDTHLQNTKNFILKSAENKAKNCAVVAGTGWCLDIPAEELAKMFGKLYFLDIFHPPQIVHKYSKYKNLEFIATDITGVSKKVYNAVKNFRKKGIKTDLSGFDYNIKNFALPPEIKADFYVSVNILNQLDILLTEFMSKEKIYTEAELQKFKEDIQKAHLSAMPASKSCLITDCIQNVYDENHEKEREEKLIFTDFPEAEFADTWEWVFDTKGTYIKNKTIVFKVRAFDF